MSETTPPATPALIPRRLSLAFAAIVVLGLLARLAAWLTEPAVHSDEFFQVLEPAWWHLTGFGLSAWEWSEGVRSWALPGYHGAWMALLMALGVTEGATLGLLMQLHGALLNLLLIGAAYRGGTLVAGRLSAGRGAPGSGAVSAEQFGGLCAALLCALFPVVVIYAPHTLSEMPSMLCFVWGIVLVNEAPTRREAADPDARRRTFVAGLVIALGTCIRIANAPLSLVAPLVLLVRRRWSLLPWLLAGAVIPVVAFGLLDLLTWGKFLGSYWKYIEFNIIQGRSAFFGTAPWHWYVEVLWNRGAIALALLLVAVFIGLRATWPFVLAALGLYALLTSQGHKEERFMIAMWPLLLIAAGGVAGTWLARLQGRWQRIAIAAAVALVLGDGAVHMHGGPGDKDRFARSWLEGQAIAGADPTVTGLVIDRSFYSGAALWFGAARPQLNFETPLLQNPIVSHALVFEGSDHERQAREAGFVPIFVRDGAVLLRRP
jgi:hypothetical protein